ncbi:MAG: hypothetical protein ACRC4L_01380 [Mycoplasma sp.]
MERKIFIVKEEDFCKNEDQITYFYDYYDERIELERKKITFSSRLEKKGYIIKEIIPTSGGKLILICYK